MAFLEFLISTVGGRSVGGKEEHALIKKIKPMIKISKNLFTKHP
jgi:hypothetical protein